MIKKFEAYNIPDWEIIDYDNDSGKILSVQRLSDDEIFSIGDTIGFVPDGEIIGVIDRLWKSYEQMRIDIGKLGLVLNDDIMKIDDVNKEVDPLKEGPIKKI